MVRNWRRPVAVALTAAGVLWSGCGGDGGSTQAVGPAVGPSYQYGDFQGALANQVIRVFAPMEWSGQTDGPVLVSADKLFTLSEAQKNALRMVLSDGHAIVVTEVTQDHLQRLHALTDRIPAVELDPNDSAALYVLTRPRGMTHVLVVKSAPEWNDPDAVESSRMEHARQVAEWFLEQRTAHQLHGAALARMDRVEEEGPAILAQGEAGDLPYLVQQLFTMPAFYSDQCGAMKSCANLGSATLSSWGVHNAKALVGQPTDYLIVRMTGTFNSNGCMLSIGDNNRFAGYWLRQAKMSANVADVTMGDYRLLNGAGIWGENWAPKAVNPTETKTSGVDVTIGGAGSLTAGATSKGPSVSGSVGFSAGVSYTNTSTVGPFSAITAKPTVGTDATNRTKLAWTYDSWAFVSDRIKPANHACGGPGLKVDDALIGEIYGDSFSAEQEWVWILSPEVRAHIPIQSDDYAYVPVDFNAFQLMGWALFPPFTNACKQDHALGTFTIGDMHFGIVGMTVMPPIPGGASVGLDEAGNVVSVTSHSNGLAFDPGCGTAVDFGTVPLGSATSGVRDGTNVGPLFSFGNVRVNLPLAPDPRLMTLTSVSTDDGTTCTTPPCSLTGVPGTIVTLRGTGLQTATRVSFGGDAPYSVSIEWETDPATGKSLAFLKATAPTRVASSDDDVVISVANAVRNLGDFHFIYKH